MTGKMKTGASSMFFFAFIPTSCFAQPGTKVSGVMAIGVMLGDGMAGMAGTKGGNGKVKIWGANDNCQAIGRRARLDSIAWHQSVLLTTLALKCMPSSQYSHGCSDTVVGGTARLNLQPKPFNFGREIDVAGGLGS